MRLWTPLPPPPPAPPPSKKKTLSSTDVSKSQTTDRGAKLSTHNDEGIPVPTSTELQGSSHAAVAKLCTTPKITVQPDLACEQQPSHLHPSPVSCITSTPTCVESQRELHSSELYQAVGDPDNILGT